MNYYIMIEIAFKSKKEVDKSVNVLLDNKLVASSQVFTSESTWNYKGKRTSRKEFILLLKTKKELINDIYNVIKDIHSYEVFEFAIFNLSSPSKEYLDWINDETKLHNQIYTL
mgnify:CR=1 FL=1